MIGAEYGKEIFGSSWFTGAISPLIWQCLAVATILVTIAAIVVIFVVLFNQKANNRLIKLITAVTFPKEGEAKPRRARNS